MQNAAAQIGFEAVWRWYSEIEKAVYQREDMVLSYLTGAEPAEPGFEGKTLEQIRAHFTWLRDELHLSVSMTLIASTEAELRRDSRNRKKKDPLSKEFQDLYKKKKKGEQPRLVEDILEIWGRNLPGAKIDIRNFIAVWKLRHWIAHGRYWGLKLGRKFTLNDVYQIVAKMSQMIENN